jgi:hypothetical protein
VPCAKERSTRRLLGGRINLMPNKLSKQEFLKRSKKSFKKSFSKYDYSKVKYINQSTKVKIKCTKNNHGYFYQVPMSHMKGFEGCTKCRDNYPYDTKSFIVTCKKRFNRRYDYSKVDYINNHTKVKIICNKHKLLFEQRPKSHLGRNEQGCNLCKKYKTYTTKLFIKISKEVHGDVYGYHLVKYKHTKKYVNIVCQTHGIFKQYPGSHLQGRGCFKCHIDTIAGTNKRSPKEWIKIFKKHAKLRKYKFFGDTIINAHIPMNVKCKDHGIFKVAPMHLRNGIGCSACSSSLVEEEIANYLNKIKIDFKRYKTFSNCKYKRLLPFDFYLPKHKLLIEYDGRQHFEPIYGGTKLKKQKMRDKIKNAWSKKNKYTLLRIPYWLDYKFEITKVIRLK